MRVGPPVARSNATSGVSSAVEPAGSPAIEGDYSAATSAETTTDDLSNAYIPIEASYLNTARDDTGTLSAEDVGYTTEAAGTGRQDYGAADPAEEAGDFAAGERETSSLPGASEAAGNEEESSTAAPSRIVGDGEYPVAQGVSSTLAAEELDRTGRTGTEAAAERTELAGNAEADAEAEGRAPTSILPDCPRCGAPVVQGQEVCGRCGLRFSTLPVALPSVAATVGAAAAMLGATPLASATYETEPLHSPEAAAILPIASASAASAPAGSADGGPPVVAWTEQPVTRESNTLPTVLALLAVLALVVAVVLAMVQNNSTGVEGTGIPTPTQLVAAVAGTTTPTPVSGVGAIATEIATIQQPAESSTTVAQVTSVPPTSVPQAVATEMPTQAPTNTAAPTATLSPPPPPTDTVPPPPPPADTVPAPTDTVQPPTATQVAPTDTIPAPANTPAPPTDTVARPTDTAVPPNTPTTAPPPSNTPVPPTPVPPTSVPPTSVPPTPVPPTPVPPVSPTPVPPTAIVQLGLGNTGSVAAWGITPAQVGTAKMLRSPDPHAMYQASGTYWLVKVSAQNSSGQAGPLVGKVDFVLKDAAGNLYPELTDHGTVPGVREISVLQGFSYVDAVVPPGGTTTVLLVFDVPRGVQPAQLVGRRIVGDHVASTGQMAWNLK